MAWAVVTEGKSYLVFLPEGVNIIKIIYMESLVQGTLMDLAENGFGEEKMGTPARWHSQPYCLDQAAVGQKLSAGMHC